MEERAMSEPKSEPEIEPEPEPEAESETRAQITGLIAAGVGDPAVLVMLRGMQEILLKLDEFELKLDEVETRPLASLPPSGYFLCFSTRSDAGSLQVSSSLSSNPFRLRHRPVLQVSF
jgi:hypothetical protein